MTRGPAKPMSAPGSARMTSPSEAKLAVTPPVVGWVRIETYGKPGLGDARKLRRGLGHLHEREDPLLHARAAGGGDDDERGLGAERHLRGAGDLLPHGRGHAAAEEAEVHDREVQRQALDGAAAGDDRLAAAGRDGLGQRSL